MDDLGTKSYGDGHRFSFSHFTSADRLPLTPIKNLPVHAAEAPAVHTYTTIFGSHSLRYLCLK